MNIISRFYGQEISELRDNGYQRIITTEELTKLRLDLEKQQRNK